MKKMLSFSIVLLVLACKKTGIEKTIPQGISIEYTENTVVIDKSPGEVIVSLDEENGIYTMKKTAFDHQPQAGEVILIPGEVLRKVKASHPMGNNYEIETEDAVLTDVIENGTIAFEITPEWVDASSLRIEGREMLAKGARLSVSPIEFNMSVSGVDHKILIEPESENGKINACTFRFQMSKGNSTSFEAVGKAKLPTQETMIYIENGKLKEFKSKNKGLDADFKVHMATAGGNSGEHSLSLPKMALSIPIQYIPTPVGLVPNPIPMSIDIGVQFVSQMTIPDELSSAEAESSVNYSADGGFEYKDANVVSIGDLTRNEIKDGRFDAAANFGMPVDLQFGVAFPRISFNIISQEVAFVHVGYTTGAKLEWGPLCKSGYSKVVVEGGYELKVLGQSLTSAKKVFKQMEKRADNDCK